LPQIIFADPDWFFWAYEKGALAKNGVPQREANEIYRKATSINIPAKEGTDKVAEYVIHPTTKNFGGFEIVPRSRPQHQGGSTTLRMDVIDLSVPRRIAQYDKWGSGRIIELMKHHLFGSESHRMTKKRCEDFFDDDSHFDLS